MGKAVLLNNATYEKQNVCRLAHFLWRPTRPSPLLPERLYRSIGLVAPRAHRLRMVWRSARFRVGSRRCHKLGTYSLARVHHCRLCIERHYLWADVQGAMEFEVQSRRRKPLRSNQLADNLRACNITASGNHRLDGQHCVQFSALL